MSNMTRLRMIRGGATLVAVCLFCLLMSEARLAAQPSSDPIPEFWRADGVVDAIVITNNVAYLGGDFTYLGPGNGAAGLVDPDFGNFLPGFPSLVGTIRAVVPDGAGGWFVGGLFTVDSAPGVQNLAHVLANNTVDSSFAPNPDATVRALLLIPGALLVGGEFFQIAGSQSSPTFAQLDPVSGGTTGIRIRVSGIVSALALDGDTVYMGGGFSSLTTFVGNQQVQVARQRLAAFKPATGEVLDWNPGCTGGQEVKVLVVTATTVYAGGDFTNCGGKPRNGIASMNKTDGTANSWNPNAQFSGGTPSVNALAVVGNVVYAGGDFTGIGARTRVRLAALTASGIALANASWVADANDVVEFIVPLGNQLLVGGRFTVIGGSLDLSNPNAPVQTGGTARKGFAQIDQALATVNDWGPQVSSLKPPNSFGGNATSWALGVQPNKLLLGGDFSSIGGVGRGRIAAISLNTGAATSWDPNADLTVRALALGPSGLLYVGGNFTNIGGQTRPHLALIRLDTGLADAWNPQGQSQPGQFVSAIAVGSGSVFVGGNFFKIGGQDRTYLAELDGTGNATAWNPAPGGQINAILYNKGEIYVGGNFFGIGGGQQQYLALLTQSSTPLVKTFNPAPDGSVRSLSLSEDNRLFVGGDFTKMAGQDRKSVAAIDPVTGEEPVTIPLDVQLVAQGQLQARSVLPLGSTVYIGGQFRGAGGENRARIASVHNIAGQASNWDPGTDQPVNVIARNSDFILIGGEFTRLGLHGANPNVSTDGQPWQYFAAFKAGPALHNIHKNTAGHWVMDVTDGDGLGSTLQIQTSDRLGSGGWQNVGPQLDVQGFQDPFEDTTSAAIPRRFYRSVRQP